jgi:hypothetical protein
VEIESGFLNVNTLQNVDKVDYLFLFSRIVKNNFILEDDYLKSTQYSLQEIDDNVPSKNINSIIVFYHGDKYIQKGILASARTYILINIEDKKVKDLFSKFVYHFFAKNEFPIIDDIEIVNENRVKFSDYKKGKAKRNEILSPYSSNLDFKSLNKFVGRKTDIENIIRKLIDLRFDNTLLSIKGAGGIGKTTIITKVSKELMDRGYYSKGVYFIQCQSMTNLQNFVFEISKCFELPSSIELINQIKENYTDKNRLIILDNFESLLNISDKDNILKILSAISDFASVVSTTRQRLDLDFEDVYELRNLTTDEGVELFKLLYPYVQDQEEKILRHEIVDRILNNNPLAIKIIAKGIPANKELDVLKKELEEDIFKDEDIDQIFERPEDINIEKTKSLYHSINYSYQRLTEKEKFTFEILSIFPDGILLENFKKFSKSSSKAKFKVGDKDIKSLEDKSLLEKNDSFLRIQSILNRFADFQFKKQDQEVRVELFTLAFQYNLFIISLLSDRRYFKRTKSLRLLDMHFNNFLKVLESIHIVDIDKEMKLKFIDDLVYPFSLTNQADPFVKLLQLNKSHFSDIENGEVLVETMIINTLYWVKDFEKTFKNLQIILPYEKLMELDNSNSIQNKILANAIGVYECEGYSYKIIELLNKVEFYSEGIVHRLYKLGYLSKAVKLIEQTKSEDKFAILEVKNSLKKIDAEYIYQHISELYKKESLEIVQCTYVLSKRMDIAEEDLRKLVISNPYTKGLITLMKISALDNEQDINDAYISAIADLKHVKYYYLEAILNYCSYLQSMRLKEFKYWYDKGYEIAKKYHFSYMVFLFEKLVTKDIGFVYNESEYTSKYAPLSDEMEIFIRKYIAMERKRVKPI